MYELPKSVEIDGIEYAIRSDYRAILDILSVFNNSELQMGVFGDERALCALMIFYPDFEQIKNQEKAFDELVRFIDRDEKNVGKSTNTKLYDFEKDESMIAPAVGQVLGCRIRELDYLHWWDFLDAFCQIGDGLFAQVVNIRSKRAKGKMTKDDRAFYAQNKEIIDRVKPVPKGAAKDVKTLTPEEGAEFLKKWREREVKKNGE